MKPYLPLILAVILTGCAPLPPVVPPSVPAATAGDQPSAASNPNANAGSDNKPDAPPATTPDSPTPAAPTPPRRGGSSGDNGEPAADGLSITLPTHPSGTWTTEGSLAVPRFGHVGLFYGDTMLVADGALRSGLELQTEDGWFEDGDLKSGDMPIAGTTDGNYLLLLNSTSLKVVDADFQVEQYGIFNPEKTLYLSRRAPAMSVVGSNLFIAGGMRDATTVSNRTLIVDLETLHPVTSPNSSVPWDYGWVATDRAPMPTAVAGAGYVPQGEKLVVIGGYTLNGTTPVAQAQVQVYDTALDTWSVDAIPALPEARHSAAATVLDGTIYLAGGRGPDGAIASEVWRWRPGEAAWTLVTYMPTPRALLSLTAAHGKLYAIGGVDTAGTPRTLVEVYRP